MLDYLSLNQGQRLYPLGYLADNPEQIQSLFFKQEEVFGINIIHNE